MRNIAIVKDNDNDASLLESHIAQISEAEKTTFNLVRFTSAGSIKKVKLVEANESASEEDNNQNE